MRTSVLDTLLDILRRNVARGARDAAVYEVGLVTRGGGPVNAPVPGIEQRPDPDTLAAILSAVPDQPRHVALAAAGDAEPGGPWGAARPVDASDAVAWARSVGTAVGLELGVAAADHAPWHPGRCASLPAGRLRGRLRRRAAPQGDGPRPAGPDRGRRARRRRPGGRDRRTLAGRTAVDLPARPHRRRARRRRGGARGGRGVSPAGGGRPVAGERGAVRHLPRRPGGGGPQVPGLPPDVPLGGTDLTTDEVSALRDRAVASAAAATGAVQR